MFSRDYVQVVFLAGMLCKRSWDLLSVWEPEAPILNYPSIAEVLFPPGLDTVTLQFSPL